MPNRKFSPAVLAVAVAALLCLAGQPAKAEARGSFQRTLTVTGPVDLDVSTGSGDIDVRSGAVGSVQITGRIKASGWSNNPEEKVRKLEQNPPIQQNGNSVRVGYISDPELRRNVSIDYTIVVPQATSLTSHTGSGDQKVDGIKGPLEARSGSGDMHISSIGGRVEAHTGSGDLQLSSVNGDVRARTGSGNIQGDGVAGAFDAETGSGDVGLRQTAAGEVRVRTGSGGVDLHGVRGMLDADTGSGEITVEGAPGGEWKLSAGSGTIKLNLPASAAFDLDASTSSGSIELNHSVTVSGNISRHSVHGKAGSGGSLVEIRTGSGDIEID
ncbi:MAG TPA: DUF4097 family beta strand repeat-containing protein [Terriglobales bacterium]|nr:DUF4097 family beta strand repeat-containing protein [Terriglobales bacterium]